MRVHEQEGQMWAGVGSVCGGGEGVVCPRCALARATYKEWLVGVPAHLEGPGVQVTGQKSKALDRLPVRGEQH